MLLTASLASAWNANLRAAAPQPQIQRYLELQSLKRTPMLASYSTLQVDGRLDAEICFPKPYVMAPITRTKTGLRMSAEPCQKRKSFR